MIKNSAPLAASGLAPALVALAPMVPWFAIGAGIGLAAWKSGRAIRSWMDRKQGDGADQSNAVSETSPSSTERTEAEHTADASLEMPSESPPGKPLPAQLASHGSFLGNPSPFLKTGRRQIVAADLKAVFANGPLTRPEAVAAIRNLTGCGMTAAYRALAPGSRFSDRLHEDDYARIHFADED